MAIRMFFYGIFRYDAPEGTKIGPAYIKGNLYEVSNGIKGANFNEDGEILGAVWEIPDDMLPVYDYIEGYTENGPEERNLYVRKNVSAKLRNGIELKCWAYEFNFDSRAKYDRVSNEG